jgi:hypothetical protein
MREEMTTDTVTEEATTAINMSDMTHTVPDTQVHQVLGDIATGAVIVTATDVNDLNNYFLHSLY